MARRKQDTPVYDPVVSRGILAIVLVVFAIIITLSFFDQAGPLGYIINNGILAFLFGKIRYATPVIILVLAGFLVKDQDYDYRPTHGIGAILFFITTASLFHINFDVPDMWRQALEGNGGGVFGMFAWVLKNYLGSVASIVLLAGLVLVSVLLMFNTAILHFLAIHKKLMANFGTIGQRIMEVSQTEDEDDGEEEYDDDDEEYDEDEEEDERKFSSRNVDDDEEYDEEEGEEEDEDEEDEEPAPSGTPVAAADPQGPWAHKPVIKALPAMTLLSSKKGKPTSGDIKSNAQIIKDTLKEFNIEVDMGEVQVGPTVTQFTLKPKKGTKLTRITSLKNDLALALAAHPIRIEAPIPGKSLVGIEVPNQKTAMVTFKELLESESFTKRKHNMMIALGKDVAGKAWMADLPRMPHLLIAGATGSGKTVCMNTIITSLLFQNTAETLRMIMVDPKRVELTLYNGIPHLLTPVITNTQKTVNALKWTIGEMERRFELLAQAGNRDISTYNAAHPNSKLPHLVFVIDELADLMATAANDVEAGIIRLAQMARAVGIHLIVATQRPSVDVITGLMKANIPARIAFSVASIIDSRTILDSPGAETLIGRGDMLFSTAEISKPKRIQGAFISETELKAVAKYLKGDEKPVYDESIVEKQSGGTASMFGGPSDDQDPLFSEAQKAILDAGKASASFLQRRLKVGYARAARILDELESAGIIGPADGAKPREILVTEREIDVTMQAGQEFNAYKETSKPPPAPEPEIEEEEEDDEYDEEEEELEDTSDEDANDEEYDEEDEELDEEDDEEEYDDEDDEDGEYDEDEDDEEYDEEDEELDEEDDSGVRTLVS